MATPESIAKYRTSAAQAASMSEVGYSGLNISGGVLREEFLAELRGKAGVKIYKEMRDNDPIIGAILFAVGMLIRQATWSLVPASEDAAAQDVADFVDSCRTDMTMTWNDVMSEVLTMLPFGWAWLETVYKKRGGYNRNEGDSSKYSDGRIGWRRMPLRSQDSLNRWIQDPVSQNVSAMEQLTLTGQSAAVPITKSLLFRTESNKNNPEGRSVLRNAYRPWYFQKRIEEIEGIGVERDLAGLPVLMPPEGLDIWNPNDPLANTYKASAETLVRNIRRDEQEGVLLPYGWTLSLLSTGGTRSFDTSSIIDRYNNVKAMTVMADFIILGHNNRYGSFALSSSKTHMFGMAIGGWLDMISDVFNRYGVPRLLAVNGINPELQPRLKHGDIEVPDLNELGSYIQKLAGSGFQIFPNASLERHLLNVARIPTEGVVLGQGTGLVNPKLGAPVAGDTGADPNAAPPTKPPEKKPPTVAAGKKVSQ
jgi:hypothetical protein